LVVVVVNINSECYIVKINLNKIIMNKDSRHEVIGGECRAIFGYADEGA
jgi:hypothetical protein